MLTYIYRPPHTSPVHDMGHPFIMFISEDSLHSHHFRAFGRGLAANYFNNACAVNALTPTVCLIEWGGGEA